MVVENLSSPAGYAFDDLEVGQRYASPRVTVTEDAIIRFALEWDPHAFHIDREEAKRSVFKQLVGSGLHTLLLTSRMVYDSGLFLRTAVAGLGMGELSFLKPLLPNDTIGTFVEVIEKKETANPATGKVKIRILTVNQHEEVIMTHTRDILVRRS